ncbi:putative sporulation protein YtxC [Cytobacillus gottheilii]|uniref:putative sporulation protein YtxC n=1 Tax=Cytobacillus gottheilii TaxID=859144 RepID=UPI0009BA1F83|nr:putative sporulation protein YtxC [Cytobacillus gottheilii]
MIEIIFRSKKDALRLHTLLQGLLTASACTDHIHLRYEDHHIVKLQFFHEAGNSIHLLKEAFYEFVIESKIEDWFRTILTDQYYYQVEEEQQQIMEIAQAIIEGNREDLSSFVPDQNVKERVRKDIHQMIQPDINFSFDSFVKFRMRSFMDQLVKYIEISIDEYKMEQEYQMFVQMLREFLTDRPAKFQEIHVLMDEGVFFYDEGMNEIRNTELRALIDRKLLFHHPVYIDSATIAPLLSIAPKKINLYCDDVELPLVRTISNIFEERLKIKSVTSFKSYESMQELSGQKREIN